MNALTSFTGLDGTRHEIGYFLGRTGGAKLLCDHWHGHGLRLLCVLPTRDKEVDAERRDGTTFTSSVEAQVDAVIREYRPSACRSARPLSRKVNRREFTVTAA